MLNYLLGEGAPEKSGSQGHVKGTMLNYLLGEGAPEKSGSQGRVEGTMLNHLFEGKGPRKKAAARTVLSNLKFRLEVISYL